MHCPGGNTTGPIWRVLASSDGISSWTSLNPQHSNPSPNPLANQLWSIDFLTLPHLSSSLPSLNLLCHSQTDARFVQDAPKAVWSIPYVSVAFFPSLKQNFIAYRCSKVSDCILKLTSCGNKSLVGCIHSIKNNKWIYIRYIFKFVEFRLRHLGFIEFFFFFFFYKTTFC